ncbi:MAG TPA: sugar phosphate isomerase/epimerase family protein, partial [Phycisphaerales bacterium]|nr:sugar phosphate isomerase/epimerase family protein [Phycisphaerales bacterium]
ELACWGDHVDVRRAAKSKSYAKDQLARLERRGLKCWAISNHLVGQAVCDAIDQRHKAILPKHVWGDGKEKGVHKRAAEEMKLTAKAAANMGVQVVNGFTGSSVWPMLYFFPPTSDADVQRGFDDFAERWSPILDVFNDEGVQFALEVHPSEIAYDVFTAQCALDAIDHHPAFAFNFDPSHLVWQGVDPVKFIDRFADRIAHVHMKDVIVRMDGERGILGSHLQFGDPRRGWEFRSVGRGDVDFEEIIRALNRINYRGPLSVEWEDAAMDREDGAAESCAYVRGLQFTPGQQVFDAAFSDSAKRKR